MLFEYAWSIVSAYKSVSRTGLKRGGDVGEGESSLIRRSKTFRFPVAWSSFRSHYADTISAVAVSTVTSPSLTRAWKCVLSCQPSASASVTSKCSCKSA